MELLTALSGRDRWRIVELLAERPRSVGELATLTGLRQPQTTKHLQALASVGVVAVYPLAQRRVYALEVGPLEELEGQIRDLVRIAVVNRDDRHILERYRDAIAADAAAAHHDRWADERTYTFERTVAAGRDVVWRYWTEPDLMARWLAPPSMTVSEAAMEAEPGGRAVLEYRDAEGTYRAEGEVAVAKVPRQLVYRLSPLLPSGEVAFDGHYDVSFSEQDDGTAIRVQLRITATTVEAVPFIAGIETGWAQVLDALARTITTRTGAAP